MWNRGAGSISGLEPASWQDRSQSRDRYCKPKSSRWHPDHSWWSTTPKCSNAMSTPQAWMHKHCVKYSNIFPYNARQFFQLYAEQKQPLREKKVLHELAFQIKRGLRATQTCATYRPCLHNQSGPEAKTRRKQLRAVPPSKLTTRMCDVH